MYDTEKAILKTWETPSVVTIDIAQIREKINQQDAALLNLLINDEDSFRLLTGSV